MSGGGRNTLSTSLKALAARSGIGRDKIGADFSLSSSNPTNLTFVAVLVQNSGAFGAGNSGLVTFLKNAACTLELSFGQSNSLYLVLVDPVLSASFSCTQPIKTR